MRKKNLFVLGLRWQSRPRRWEESFGRTLFNLHFNNGLLNLTSKITMGNRVPRYFVVPPSQTKKGAHKGLYSCQGNTEMHKWLQETCKKMLYMAKLVGKIVCIGQNWITRDYGESVTLATQESLNYCIPGRWAANLFKNLWWQSPPPSEFSKTPRHFPSFLSMSHE